MNSYIIRRVAKNDIKEIVSIYNSNHKFLLNHLGMDSVDSSFIIEEISEMTANDFLSCAIVDTLSNEIIGLIDYRVGETVYLSLMMIHSDYQHKGIGDMSYNKFEENMRILGEKAIRIDVVNDYPNNAIAFWEKQGFIQQNEIKLQWGNKKSTAVVMIKYLE